MTVLQRQKHLEKLAKIQVAISQGVKRKETAIEPTPTAKRPCTPADLPCCSRQLLAEHLDEVILPVKVEEFSGQVLTPAPVLEAIWKKAVDLLSEKNAICAAPVSTNQSCMVKSYTGSRPHLVLAKKGGQYACDTVCGNFKSLGICSHAVATAQYNGQLQKFIEWFCQAKRCPNLTKLVTSQMPAGCGRKGGKPARRRKKKSDATSRVVFSDRFSVPSTEAATVSTETSIIPPSSSACNLSPPPLVPIASAYATVVTSSSLPDSPKSPPLQLKTARRHIPVFPLCYHTSVFRLSLLHWCRVHLL